MRSLADLLRRRAEALLDLARKIELDIDPSTILDTVSAAFCVSRDQILGKSHQSHSVLARHVAIYLIRKDCPLGYPQIGAIFNRHHTACIHAVRQIEARIESSPPFAALVEGLRTNGSNPNAIRQEHNGFGGKEPDGNRNHGEAVRG